MGAALELIVIPVLLMIVLVVAGVMSDLSVGSVLVGAIIIGLLTAAVIALLRLERGQDVAAGVDEADEGAREEEESSQSARPIPIRRALDLVDECGDESFPASDPPSWTGGRDDAA